ncbi:molybdenum cofactor guanylyltransferase MobA [Rhodovulum adriaticum]|uniref:Molybdenum cofactor guanylyltransferase n=1 Tax=Rhodovulum adriaticum TaxID=35804 RepID=A0A4R2P0K0_RHOAD|nr:molybdenum cofactor guanylyltransferase MobA [Rhodovulum adriaticum]TCP27588.1 molybdenum cofactor guanylyltransferase [Rhodovulum adriaticum]
MEVLKFRTETPSCPGVVLAGGRSSRMGGRDKALLPLGADRMIDHVLMRLVPQCSAVALNRNGGSAPLAGLGLQFLSDPFPGYPGPLAGILSAMEWAAGQGASHVVTVAVDTPFFPGNLVARLWASKTDTSGPVLASCPDEAGVSRLHPAFGLWPASLRADARKALIDGKRKVRQWAKGLDPAIAEFDRLSYDPFLNVNTPQDLARAERLLPLVNRQQRQTT